MVIYPWLRFVYCGAARMRFPPSPLLSAAVPTSDAFKVSDEPASTRNAASVVLVEINGDAPAATYEALPMLELPPVARMFPEVTTRFIPPDVANPRSTEPLKSSELIVRFAKPGLVKSVLEVVSFTLSVANLAFNPTRVPELRFIVTTVPPLVA
jgi:hypothetical protein